MNKFLLGMAGAIIAIIVVLAIVAPEEAEYGGEWWWSTWDWIYHHGLPLMIYIIVGTVLYSLVQRVIPRVIRQTMTAKEKGRLEAEIDQRIHTLSTVLTNTCSTVIFVVVTAVILDELGVNIAAFVGLLGVLAVAVGFGAQSLVKDLISGFFILLEDQYCVGDWIALCGVDGEVERLNLRRTCVRDLDGVIHSIPNGAMTVSSNYTKDFGRCNVTVSVAYKEDLDQVLAIVRQTWDELVADPNWAPYITEKVPWILRVDSLGDSGIGIRIVARTLPDWQWAIMAQMRLRLKKKFDELGIEIPWPHTKVFFGNMPPEISQKSDA